MMTLESLRWLAIGVLCFTQVIAAPAAEHHDHHHHSHHGMTMDRDGMVMNENADQLPEDCTAISAEIEIEVEVGREFARRGAAFGFSAHEWRVPGCSRLTVTLVNRDQVRHQWMVHGLPRYLYPQGMFHLEVSGGKKKSGTFIVPSDQRTYLAHCDISQHMEKGLKAQLLVAEGDGNLPSIPGISAARMPDRYRD